MDSPSIINGVLLANLSSGNTIISKKLQEFEILNEIFPKRANSGRMALTYGKWPGIISPCRWT